MVYNGTQTVAAAGTRVALTPGVRTLAAWIMLYANTANTNAIYHGGSKVDSTVGMPLLGGQKDVYWPQVNVLYDLSTIYIDADTNGNSVRFVYGRS